MIKAKVNIAAAKAVIKYALATAYTYLDEKGLNKLYKDVVEQLDEILIATSFNRSFTDNQVVDEQAIITAAKVLSDVYSVSDHIDIAKTFGRVFTESQSQTDAITYIDTIKGIADTAVPVESLDRTVSYNRTFNDVVNPIDAIIAIFFGDVEIDGVIVDPFGIDDDPAIVLNKPFEDVYTGTTESYASEFITSRSETVDSPDAFSRIISYLREYSELVDQTDIFDRTVEFNRTNTEEIINTEFVEKGIDSLMEGEFVSNEDERITTFELPKEEEQTQEDQNVLDVEKPFDEESISSDDYYNEFDSLKTEDQPQEDTTTFSQDLNKSDESTSVDFEFFNFNKNVIFAPYSYYFNNNSNDYVSYTLNPSIVPYGTEDWTIEGWIYPTSATNGGIYSTSHTSGYGLEIDWMNTGRIRVLGNNGNSFQLDSTTGDTPLNTWTYFSVTRSSNTIRIFINGVLKNSLSYSGDFDYGSATTARIGCGNGGSFYGGYISNLRVVVGTSVYNTNYPPPTSELENIPGTELLTGQKDGFFDFSHNNLLLSPGGNVQTIRFSILLPDDRVETVGDEKYITSELVKSEEQSSDDVIDYINSFDRVFDESQDNLDDAYLETSKYLEMESVILSDIAEIIYYVGRIFDDPQFVEDVYSSIIEFIRNFDDSVEQSDSNYFDFVQGTTSDFVGPIDLSTLQYYKYLDETQTQQDTGSLVSSDYVINYGDYFSEYYVGVVRTFN